MAAMLSGARPGGGLSPAAEAGLRVDIRAKPDSAARRDRAVTSEWQLN